MHVDLIYKSSWRFLPEFKPWTRLFAFHIVIVNYYATSGAPRNPHLHFSSNSLLKTSESLEIYENLDTKNKLRGIPLSKQQMS